MFRSIIAIVFAVIFIGSAMQPAYAGMFDGGSDVVDPLGLEYGQATGLSDEDVRLSTARIINAVLGLLGIISVVIIVYAGFKWMTSGGNDETIADARKMLIAAVIGLIIILSAFIISRYVLDAVYQATSGRNVIQ